MKDFYDFFEKKYSEGKHKLSNAIKLLVFKEDEYIFNLLDFEKEDIFMNPLLFGYFNSSIKKMTLPQILYGYINKSKRPRIIQVMSDGDGFVYVPQIGYFLTNNHSCQLELLWDEQIDTFTILANGYSVECNFKEILYFTNLNVEIYRHGNPLFKEIYFNTSSQLKIEETLKSYTEELKKSISIIEENYFEFYQLFIDSVRGIMVYFTEEQRSFASIKTNGAAFLRIKEGESIFYILEDILHQCSHIIFFSIIWNKNELFNLSPDTPLKDITKKGGENRRLLGAFYSFYTYCSICEFFNRILDSSDNFFIQNRKEIIGRFAYCMYKFKSDIDNFSYKKIFTRHGRVYFEWFKVFYNKLYSKRAALLQNVNTFNQDYEFNLTKFNLINENIALNNI